MSKQSNRKVKLHTGTSAIIILSLADAARTAAQNHATVPEFATSFATSILGLLAAFAISVQANLLDSHTTSEDCSNCRRH